VVRLFPPVPLPLLFTNMAGISMSVDQGPYPRPVAELVYKSDVPEHFY